MLVRYCFSFLSEMAIEPSINCFHLKSRITLYWSRNFAFCQILLQIFFEKLSQKLILHKLLQPLSCIQISFPLSQTCLAALDWTFSVLFMHNAEDWRWIGIDEIVPFFPVMLFFSENKGPGIMNVFFIDFKIELSFTICFVCLSFRGPFYNIKN